MEIKECTKCKVLKPLVEFYKRSDCDNYKSQCKECYKQRKPKKEHVPAKNMTTHDPHAFRIKTCKNCGFTGEMRKFFTRGNVRGTWQYGHCKKCTNEKLRASRYKMTVEDMRVLLNESTECKICEREFTSIRKVIDHCHTEGHVRGVLCDQCNQTLGQLEKKEWLLEKFVNYIKLNKKKK